MGYGIKRQIVGIVRNAHARWARERDHALTARQRAGLGFDVAGLKLFNEIYIGNLSRGADEAIERIVNATKAGSVARKEAQEALHSALDVHFADPQEHVLTGNSEIQAALRGIHERIRLCGEARPACGSPWLTLLCRRILRKG